MVYLIVQVRGAPAIAIVALLSLAAHLFAHEQEYTSLSMSAFKTRIQAHLDYLMTSRPTAVQLKQSCDQLRSMMNEWDHDEPGCGVVWAMTRLEEVAVEWWLKDVHDNKTMGKLGGDWLIQHWSKIDAQQQEKKKRCVMTHCNTGSLATAEVGTALGIIRYLSQKNELNQVICTETRPYNQGSRLTAYELVTDHLPNPTLICDNMVAAMMSSQRIDAVIVGADRLARNGDTANKIGTYQMAVLARHFGVPFIVACPVSTIDFALETGAEIPIEQRSKQEVVSVCGWSRERGEWVGVDVGVQSDQLSVWHPGFDVTPAHLIDAIVTEKGVFTKSHPHATAFDLEPLLQTKKA